MNYNIQVIFLQEAAKRVVAAVCAAPTAFLSHGIAKGKRVTSYPSFKEKMETGDYTYLEVRGLDILFSFAKQPHETLKYLAGQSCCR
jgi:putative intracellular protease/amidase